jgi:DNA (cytosine-5)-methyltransferase 1
MGYTHPKKRKYFMKRYIVRALREHKGHPRVYLDIAAIAIAGFEPGKTYVRSSNPEKGTLTLRLQDNGTHVVSRKSLANGKVLPVIDINSSDILKSFEGQQAVRIVIGTNTITILPIASEVHRAERTRRLAENIAQGRIVTGSLSHGGGILDHAAENGLQIAGLSAQLVMANEIDEDLLANSQSVNDVWKANTIAIAAPMQELVQDEWAMGKLPKVDLLAVGIPCSGASRAGASKRGLNMMESHPEVGHLAASLLMVIQRIQPAAIVVECVPEYQLTASAQIIRQHLRDCAYDVQEVILSAKDFGCLENRKRWFMVAATNGITINLQGLEPINATTGTLADCLDPIGEDSPEWRSFDYLKQKEVRDAEKGNGFGMQVITSESTSVPVLRKGYHKGGSTDPLLAHPSNPDLLRQLTVAEHARVKGVPSHLVAGLTKTDGHILLGQGVAYKPVLALFERIGQEIVRWSQALGQSITTPHQPAYRLGVATG